MLQKNKTKNILLISICGNISEQLLYCNYSDFSIKITLSDGPNFPEIYFVRQIKLLEEHSKLTLSALTLPLFCVLHV